ncbi:MAG: hypothetical protein HKN03_17565, partial [Acidimicrobiales bacterium]|nr:hypothetical protein [Acidimicrobiales bacterium]
MEPGTDDQWSWWDAPDNPPSNSGTAVPATRPTTHPPAADLAATETPAEAVVLQHDERVRKVLIGLVALLAVSLAAASYARFGPDGTAQTIASSSVDPPPSPTETITAVPATSQVPATTSQPSTT